MKTRQKTEQALAAYAKLTWAKQELDLLLEEQLRTFDLTMTQFRVLRAIAKSGPTSQVALCEHLLSGEGSMSVVLRGMERRSLIARRGHEKDRRKLSVHLTPEGRALVMEVAPLHGDVVRGLMSPLSYREQKILAGLCAKLAAGDPVRFVREIVRHEVDEDEA